MTSGWNESITDVFRCACFRRSKIVGWRIVASSRSIKRTRGRTQLTRRWFPWGHIRRFGWRQVWSSGTRWCTSINVAHGLSRAATSTSWSKKWAERLKNFFGEVKIQSNFCPSFLNIEYTVTMTLVRSNKTCPIHYCSCYECFYSSTVALVRHHYQILSDRGPVLRKYINGCRVFPFIDVLPL